MPLDPSSRRTRCAVRAVEPRSSAIPIASTRMLRQLFSEVAAPDAQVAVLALGGYGRRHLCLQSDIDLLVLFGGRIGADEEQFLRGFLHPLWDLGVVVGHQVRELDDFNRLETDNPEFLLALLDARPVAGARALFDRFGALFHTASTHAYILKSLLELIDRASRGLQRHAVSARARREGSAGGAARSRRRRARSRC